MPKSPEADVHHDHYSMQSGHLERGIVNKALSQVEGLSRGQVWINTRYMPRHTRDGKR